ncbi:gp53-like domain-containing protein [Paludibacterium purpuratum]|uniref:Putative tail fiber protein gp53-like C-terminal domain-containing protein n=1 Tax=Paludibacterium purpuratum TaxID=1144873 RepID=A0A4V3DVC4_9NEIS|nr:hypothetical protein [Paludibacterium purpuratum]TDR79989.1 hypothetical protein DFP86_106129 [Paludibacterium purpuratum]
MSKVLGSQIQVGASGTAANNLVLDASANNGTASLYMGAPGTPSVPVAMINSLGQLGLGSLGAGSGVVTNANGTAIQLPGGFILQFCTSALIAGNSSTTITFPTPFPTAFVAGVSSCSGSDNSARGANIGNPTKTQMTLFSNTAASGYYFWFAIGN